MKKTKKYNLEWINNDAIVSFSGDIDFKDIMDANNELISDKRFDEMNYQIFDYSHITSLDESHDVAEIISKLDTAACVWNHNVKVATVTSDPFLRRLIEYYNQKMEGTSWIAKTFDTIETAKKWCC